MARRDFAARDIHLRKTAAEVRKVFPGGALGATTSGAPTDALVVLNELTSKGVYLFASSPMTPGQKINLTINHPKLFFVRGRVIGCQSLSGEARVMQSNRLTYRIVVAFDYDSFYEQEQVRIYCRELANTYLYPRSVA